jgi:rubrerythrin
MVSSTALKNTWVSFDDFGNDAGQPGTTENRIGKAVKVKVWKCPECGHSFEK